MERKIIHTPSLFKVDNTFSDERFMRVRIAVMHSGVNRNASSFPTKVIRDAKDTFANIPILANVISYEDEDGNTVMDYHSHDMYIEEDKFHNGEQKVIYEERVVGVVPETNNFKIVTDKESGVDYAYVDALLYREYGNYCVDILEAKGGVTDVSAEIYCDDISINAQTQVMEVGKMCMSGITLLGDDITPGMKGANAATFSLEGETIQSQLMVVISELTAALNNYNALMGEQKSKEGGQPAMDKFNELLEKYGVKAEDVTFEYEQLSDEELEAKFEEIFGTSEDFENDNNDPEDDENDGSENNPDEDDTDSFSVKYSVEFNGKTVNMSVSLQDKINALYQLVNETYSDDGTWYEVMVYDEDRYVIMVDWYNNKGYKQSFKVKNDSYTLTGDRVEVFSRWLTADEISKLDRMKSTYSEMEEKLNKYEDEPRKMEILNSEDYSLIADDEEFMSLKDEKNHFDLSVEEVTRRADEILTNAAKAHRFSSPKEKVNEPKLRPLAPAAKKAKRYGSLFEGIV